MAHRESAPFQAQRVQDVAEMLRGLESHQKKGQGKGGFSCKKSTFTVGTDAKSIDSWRFQDWDYKKPNLPTYARGLFTYCSPEGKPEIVVRGYDKFFNHGEVKSTEWRNVEQHTRGPYELSVKENGCIIFIAGMEDGTLLVCSKHSTGAREDTDVSHAVAGENWVDRQLKTVGRTRADLAKQLHEMNATAVAELCDDQFEEHVLAYNPETAGLYLHGINLNLPEFVTYPGHLVDRFATEWGFKKTMYVMEDDTKQVKSFLDKIAETGSYAGRETEGFVIRCQAREGADSPWHDWFFKYKFEEPYLMYRQWRECTKAIIAGKEPRYKKHKKITEEYLQYARRQLHANPELRKQYNLNHGIIAMRDGFLKERGLKGSDIIRQEIEGGEVGSASVTKDVVLVPVATIGCGKTTVAIALVKLFDWGHVQNDNIQGKQRPQRFAQAICDSLAGHPAMIADRNNHQKRERKQLIEDVQKIVPNAHFVALNYVHEPMDYDHIRDVTRERVLGRGDNHQTIQAGSKSPAEIIGIMEGFLQRFEPVNPEASPDDSFDHIVNLDVAASSRENLETVVAQLNAEYPKLFGKMPTAEELDNAIESALNDYKPDIKHEVKGGYAKENKKQKVQGAPATQQSGNSTTAAKDPKLEFFCIQLPSSRINSILDAIFRDQTPETARLYRHLHSSRRIQSEFHVTLIHRASASQHPQLWQQLSDLHTSLTRKANSDPSRKNSAAANDDASAPPPSPDPDLGTVKVLLERLIWDERLMCIVVRLLSSRAADGSAADFASVNEVPHVTVGTANATVKPKESNDLLNKWLAHGSGADTGLRELPVRGHVELEGRVKGVLQRR